MLANHAQRPPCFAQLHAALIAYGHRIRKHDHELTAIAENVYVGPVAALVAGVDPDREAGNDDFRHDRDYT